MYALLRSLSTEVYFCYPFSIYRLVFGFYSVGLLVIGNLGVGVFYVGWVWFKTLLTNLEGGRGTHKEGS